MSELIKGEFLKTLLKRLRAALAIGMSVTILTAVPVLATAKVIVTPSNQQGWSEADTRPGGDVNFVTDNSAPSGGGALQLITDNTPAAKAQYLREANTPLDAVTELSYYTKQVSASFAEGDPSYQLIVCLNGEPTATTCPGFTTLVYEPYQNPAQGTVVTNTWQQWDVDAGLFWSTRTVTCSSGVVVGSPGGPATYDLNQVKAACPNAVVIGYGVNIGTNNPAYNVYTDLFNFNGTVYDFELTKNDCKKGGWMSNFLNLYKNQGDCVSHYASGGRR